MDDVSKYLTVTVSIEREDGKVESFFVKTRNAESVFQAIQAFMLLDSVTKALEQGNDDQPELPLN